MIRLSEGEFIPEGCLLLLLMTEIMSEYRLVVGGRKGGVQSFLIQRTASGT